MPHSHHRSDFRYLVTLPLVLKVGARAAEGVTVNTSFEGCFVKLAEGALLPDFTPRALVRIAIVLPNEASKEPLETPATVVHVIRPSRTRSVRARPCGLGLRFFARGRHTSDRWDAFIASLRSDVASPVGFGLRIPQGERFRPMRYRSERHAAVLRVRVSTIADLYAMLDPSFDGMFIATHEPAKVGDEIGVQLVHPDSDDIFELSARVTRAVRGPEARGINVDFLDLDPERRARLADFTDDGLEALFDDEAFLEESAAE